MTSRKPIDDARRQPTAVSSSAMETHFAHRPWLLALVLAVVTLAAYQPTWHAGFIWDDDGLITGNRMIKDGDGLRKLWFSTEPRDYYPMTGSLCWLEWRAWGNNATGYHVLNVLLHAVNAMLVWMILRRLNIPGAWLAALVFAVHPINVATVAWISEQKNTLSMLFAAVAVLLWLRFCDEGRWRWYGFSLAAFLLALLSKSAVVMLPVVLLGCVWWTRGRVRWKDVWCGLPFFVTSLVLGLITVWFQYHRAMLENPVRSDSFLARLAIAGWVPWFYLYKALLPLNLTVIYAKWQIDAGHWVSYLPGALLVVCFLVFWWKRRTWGRPLLFGLGYFVVTLFPVLGFLDQGFYRYSLVADHWLYYSIVGVIALAVAAGVELCHRLGQRARSVGVVAGVGVLTVLGAATWGRACVYAGEETLWRDTLKKNPRAWMAHNNLGNVLLREGKTSDAIGHYEQTLRLNPDFAEAHYNLGIALAQTGKIEEAIAHYEQALRIKPDYAAAHINLGVILRNQGKVPEAIAHYEQALRIKPDDSEAHNDLGVALAQTGKFEEAITHYEQASRIKPDDAEGHYNLGLAFAEVGRVPEAMKQWEKALQIKPDFAGAHYNLGIALAQTGKIQEAITHYEQALRIKPDYTEAHINLGNALARTGKLQEAVTAFEQELQINPDNAEAHSNLGAVLQSMGKLPQAVAEYEQALRSKPDYVEGHYNLALALERSGRTPEAIEQYQQALKLRPDFAPARNALARLHAGQ
ncbi:MAG: tetratricopeptide repeat protein [Verrucomicrobiia bacterium]